MIIRPLFAPEEQREVLVKNPISQLVRLSFVNLLYLIPISQQAMLQSKIEIRVSDQQRQSLSIGPSGVRALPLAAGITVGGHYKWHFFLFFLLLLPAHC